MSSPMTRMGSDWSRIVFQNHPPADPASKTTLTPSLFSISRIRCTLLCLYLATNRFRETKTLCAPAWNVVRPGRFWGAFSRLSLWGEDATDFFLVGNTDQTTGLEKEIILSRGERPGAVDDPPRRVEPALVGVGHLGDDEDGGGQGKGSQAG